MASSLFRQLNQIGMQNQTPQNSGNGFQNPQNIVNQVGGIQNMTARMKEFSGLLKGDPQQIGMAMVQNGTIPKQFYNQFKPIIMELMKIMPK